VPNTGSARANGSDRATGSVRTTGLDPWLFQMLRVYLSGASILVIFGGAAAVVLALPGSHRQTVSYVGIASGVILAAQCLSSSGLCS
jgi:hypothetical protein